jgi:hypothetical protein
MAPPATHGSGLWFTFPGWGNYNLSGISEKELVVTGAHGYPTESESEAHPNASPDTIQVGLLQDFNVSSLSPGGAGAVGILSTPHSTGGVTGVANNIVNSATGGTVPDFLSQPNLWLRIGEFAVGAILIYVGLRSMFPSQVQAVTGPIKAAAKVVK